LFGKTAQPSRIETFVWHQTLLLGKLPVLADHFGNVFALSAPGADYDDCTYADLRDASGQTATVFKTFNACYGAMDTAYSKTLKDLGADGDGTLLNDKTKSIGLRATCVRVY
jgi:hypothetical protein